LGVPGGKLQPPARAQVQGHVAQTDIDPGAAVEWLRLADGQLRPPLSAGVTLR